MTKYRTISNGYVNFLQYKEIKTFRILFYKKQVERWINVPTDYYDLIWGRELDVLGYKNYINDYNTNLEDFVRRYPDVTIWLQIVNDKIEQKKKEAMEKRRLRDELRGKTKDLN